MRETDSPRYASCVSVYIRMCTSVARNMLAWMTVRPSVLGMWNFSMSDMTVNAQVGEIWGKKNQSNGDKKYRKSGGTKNWRLLLEIKVFDIPCNAKGQYPQKWASWSLLRESVFYIVGLLLKDDVICSVWSAAMKLAHNILEMRVNVVINFFFHCCGMENGFITFSIVRVFYDLDLAFF